MTVPHSGLAASDLKARKTGGYDIDGKVLTSIRQASKKTGVDFGYLMAQAAQESSFQTDAKASTSSATGLYQFIDSTWLSMVQQHGAKHGMGDLAASIQSDGRGGFSVADAASRQKILDMRKDPKAAAALGAEFALTNKEQLEGSLGRKVGAAELYLAHFLGAGGASRFIKAVDRNASQPAAELLPQAAAANRNVFFDRETGKPRTVGEIFQRFARSIESKSDQFAALDGGDAAKGFGPRVAFVAKAGGTVTPPTGGGGVASYPDTQGPTMSLMSVLALAALDALGPNADKAGEERFTEAASQRRLDQRI